MDAVKLAGAVLFLSTLSLRRATQAKAFKVSALCISIHALLAESDFIWIDKTQSAPNFYPRSPCGERRQVKQTCRAEIIFLSTLSLRRATAADMSARREASISIHALLAESDQAKAFKVSALCISIHALLAESDIIRQHSKPDGSNFYPRSPCGERRELRNPSRPGKINFYPRSPCGERQH